MNTYKFSNYLITVVGIIFYCLAFLFIDGCASMQTLLNEMNVQYLGREFTSNSQPTSRTAFIGYKLENDKVKNYFEYGPTNLRSPKPESIFLIINLAFQNLPGREVEMKAEYITIRNNSGKQWTGFFWSGDSSRGAWCGHLLNCSKSKMEVVFEANGFFLPVPEEVRRKTGLITGSMAGPLTITGKFEGNTIKLLFEVPIENSKELSLWYFDRLINKIEPN